MVLHSNCLLLIVVSEMLVLEVLIQKFVVYNFNQEQTMETHSSRRGIVLLFL